MERTFAPPDDRLRSLIAREKLMPAASKPLIRISRTRRAFIPRLPWNNSQTSSPFSNRTYPRPLNRRRTNSSSKSLHRSNGAVIAALQSYQAWLKKDVLPRSHGDFRYGAETFSKMLQYNEMVDTPLPRLLEIGYADLHQNQAEFNRIAKEIDPNSQPREILAELGRDHPAPDHLLQSFRDTFQGLIEFIQARHIVEIPSQVRPIVEETPPFMRATTVASMDTPGPFEKVATQAYFNVTVPEPHDTPRQIEERMADFNRGTIISTAIHEAYPGHYIQFLWVPQAPSTVRKLLGANSNAEGWAHYCEQMMLDQGYGQPGTGARDARDAKMIRLGQLQDALLRDARFVVGIQMHTGEDDVRSGGRLFCNGRVSNARGRPDRNQARNNRCNLSLLHLG